MLLGFIATFVIAWELIYVTGFYTKVGSVAYMLVMGLLVGGTIFFFKSDRILELSFVQKYHVVLLRLGIVAGVQSLVFLMLYLFTSWI